MAFRYNLSCFYMHLIHYFLFLLPVLMYLFVCSVEADCSTWQLYRTCDTMRATCHCWSHGSPYCSYSIESSWPNSRRPPTNVLIIMGNTNVLHSSRENIKTGKFWTKLMLQYGYCHSHSSQFWLRLVPCSNNDCIAWVNQCKLKWVQQLQQPTYYA